MYKIDLSDRQYIHNINIANNKKHKKVQFSSKFSFVFKVFHSYLMTYLMAIAENRLYFNIPFEVQK